MPKALRLLILSLKNSLKDYDTINLHKLELNIIDWVIPKFRAGIAQRFFDLYTAYHYATKDLEGYFIIEDFGSKRYSLYSKYLTIAEFYKNFSSKYKYKNKLFFAFVNFRCISSSSYYDLFFNKDDGELYGFMTWIYTNSNLSSQFDYGIEEWPSFYTLRSFEGYLSRLRIEEEILSFYNSVLWNILKINRKNKNDFAVITFINKELTKIDQRGTIGNKFTFRSIRDLYFVIFGVYRHIYFLIFRAFKEGEFYIFNFRHNDNDNHYKNYPNVFSKSKYFKGFFNFILSLSNIEKSVELDGAPMTSIPPKYSNSSLALLFSTFLLD
jgi:hypothetical protein